MLSEWGASEREPRPFAWLSVDSRDDDSTLFWNHVIAALRTVVPGICERPLALLRAPGTEAVREMLPLLINEIASLREPIVLVLDDYHLVEDPAIHEELSYLIEHLPAQLQVVVLSRTEPPLPLARLRVRGQLAEVDARALSFSETETRALVNDLHGLTLGADDVLRLRDRTEGWAAGLYLAVLSLDGRDDAGGFITAFAGDDRQVVDYLGTEVLAGQSDEVREFMLRTSILERLSAPACDALTDAPDSARLLGEIARSNFFLVPLDTKGERYRYHHLFGQLLRHELLRTRPELASELHRRAAAWLLAAGYASDAIHHTIAAGDISEAGELIAEHWAPTLLGAAGDRTVDSWLSGLPDEAIRADVRLAFARCFVGLSLGHMDEVEKWLAAGEAAPLPAPFRDGVASAKGALACVRAAFLWERGDVSAAMEAGHDARQAEEGSPWEAIGVAVIGLAHAARGQWQEGREWMAEYARIGSESGHHLNHSSGLSTAAACHAELGDWEAAERTATQALDIARRHGIDEHWCTAHAHLAQGLALESRGDSAAAGDALERALERARRGSGAGVYGVAAAAPRPTAVGPRETRWGARPARGSAGRARLRARQRHHGRALDRSRGKFRGHPDAPCPRRRAPERSRAGRAPPTRHRADPARNRPRALPVAQHGQDPRPQHLSQARRLVARRRGEPGASARPAVGQSRRCNARSRGST